MVLFDVSAALANNQALFLAMLYSSLVDKFSERFERLDLSCIGSALSHKIDATAAQKDKKL
jgi:hypothetical protein